MAERSEGYQFRFRGLEPSPRRLRRARTAFKRLPESEKSIVLEEVWAEYLAPAFLQGAQAWKDSRASFNFRDCDEMTNQEYVDPDYAEIGLDSEKALISAIQVAESKKLYASTLRDRIKKERISLASDTNDTIGWTRKYVNHVMILVGKVYHLQKSTVNKYQKMIHEPARKLEPRLR